MRLYLLPLWLSSLVLALVVRPAVAVSLPPFVPAAARPTAVSPDPRIQAMLDQVTAKDAYNYDRGLAGESAVWVDGAWYTISTRYTYSGTPIQKSTRYVGQHLADRGLDVEYQQWDTANNPNVIGELTGTTDPETVFIIGAHLDDVEDTPGADDNASGCVATLMAADILSEYTWGCTLRFAFWTGEEQNLWGSDAYAYRAWRDGENIAGYLNLDMIGYSTAGSAPGIDLMYDPDTSGSHELALLFADVVDAYDLALAPEVLPDYWWESDHASFWEYGYNSIMAIEDDDDFNPWYHAPGDTPARLNQAYFAEFIKASLATFAHMSGCLMGDEMGTLGGRVETAGGGSLSGAVVTVRGEAGESWSTFTGPTGDYALDLPPGIYTATALARGYRPVSVSDVEIAACALTTLNFSLQAAPLVPAYLPLIARR